MNRRTRTETVTFARPFALAGLDEILPAGAYAVETDEELVDAASFAAWRKVLVLMHLPPDPRHPGRERTLSLEPVVLEEALSRDRAGAEAMPRQAPHPAPPLAGEDQMTPTGHGSTDPAADAEMARHGITRVPVDYFHLGDFRYTNLADALAQARRQVSAASPALVAE